MAIVVLINLKGGVAKTNTVAIAECLASEGYRTLLIDADHLCMAGEMLLDEKCQLRCENTKRTMHDLLTVMLELEFIRTRFNSFVTHKASNIGGGLANLAVFPCSKRIDDISTNMAKAHHGHRSNDDFLRMLSKRRK